MPEVLEGKARQWGRLKERPKKPETGECVGSFEAKWSLPCDCGTVFLSGGPGGLLALQCVPGIRSGCSEAQFLPISLLCFPFTKSSVC